MPLLLYLIVKYRLTLALQTTYHKYRPLVRLKSKSFYQKRNGCQQPKEKNFWFFSAPEKNGQLFVALHQVRESYQRFCCCQQRDQDFFTTTKQLSITYLIDGLNDHFHLQ
jgi:hypothetical protein